MMTPFEEALIYGEIKIDVINIYYGSKEANLYTTGHNKQRTEEFMEEFKTRLQRYFGEKNEEKSG